MPHDVGWIGFVDDAGKFTLDRRKDFATWIKKFAGSEVVLTVKRRQKPRSLPQLRYFRGVVIPDIAMSQGYSDPDDFQAVYNGVMFKFVPLPPGPFGAPRRRSLALDEKGMSASERTELIDRVIMWAETELTGCTIRRPDDVDLGKVIDPGWA